MEMFRKTCIDAIGDAHQTLVSDNWVTLLTKFAGVIVSMATLGATNYIMDRSMYGLFSSRIDTAVKLSQFLNDAGYIAPKSPPYSTEVVEVFATEIIEESAPSKTNFQLKI